MVGSFFSGNELYKGACSQAQYRAHCGLYVAGVVDYEITVAEYEKRSPAFCVPRDVPLGQLADIFAKELREHPERRHYRGAILVIGALNEAFPCT
jgi:hypothetical protein